ncbi:MAG: hypothetical protein FWG89_02980 [Treponema sp.]|nr:hypothetical protein [Treponema sp.]
MIRKKKLIIIGAISLLIIIIGALLIFTPGESLHIPIKGPIIFLDHPPRLSNVIPYIQDGDIILRMAEGTWSMVFREYSPVDKRFSHLGIVRMRDNRITIIQSMGSFTNPNLGVEEIPLYRFMSVASAIGIFRLRGADGTVISDTAIQYMDRLFDFDFDHTDDSKVYCTELLYLALKPLQLEHILPTVYAEEVNRQIIPMDSVSNNPAFDELAYIVDQTVQRTDEEKEIVLTRPNPVKLKFLQRLPPLLGRIRR